MNRLLVVIVVLLVPLAILFGFRAAAVSRAQQQALREYHRSVLEKVRAESLATERRDPFGNSFELPTGNEQGGDRSIFAESSGLSDAKEQDEPAPGEEVNDLFEDPNEDAPDSGSVDEEEPDAFYEELEYRSGRERSARRDQRERDRQRERSEAEFQKQKERAHEYGEQLARSALEKATRELRRLEREREELRQRGDLDRERASELEDAMIRERAALSEITRSADELARGRAPARYGRAPEANDRAGELEPDGDSSRRQESEAGDFEERFLRAAELWRAAEWLRRAGREKLSVELRREASEAARALQAERELRARRDDPREPGGESASSQQVIRAVRELRDEVRDLRREIRELREALDR